MAYMRQVDNSSSLVDFFRRNFPERFNGGRLYHYSSPKLLDTFFSDNADFYCTYYASLNDDHEIVEGWDAVLAYLKDALGVPDEKIDVLKRGYRELFYNDVASPWIMSFSEDGDSLYQWSMYGDRLLGGYAFGFDREELLNRTCQVRSKSENASCPFDIWLTPCFYDVDSLQKIFDFYFNKHREAIERFMIADISSTEVLDLASKVAVMATLVKHRSFASEREWRLVKFPHGPMFETCDFVGDKPRHKTGMFRDDFPLRNFIREIVVSPHGNKRVLGMNAAIYAMKYHLCIDVQDSISPYNGR